MEKITTPFGTIITSHAIPKNELWFVTPGEQLQLIKPEEEPVSYHIEGFQQEDGIINFLLVRRVNGRIIDAKLPKVHKIIGIGDKK